MTITVKDLAAFASVLAGSRGLGRRIACAQIAAPDLNAAAAAWTGPASCVLHLRPGQIATLCSLAPRDLRSAVRDLLRQKPACIVVSGGAVCTELLTRAETAGIPVLKTGNVPRLARLLVERLSTRITVHGVLVQIFGLGTLIIGESAVGKSEAALDLVLRGHKLTADDVVVIEKNDKEITGKPADLGENLLQIRGLGVVDVRALYGESATVNSSRIGLVVELEEWREGHQYSLVGLRERRHRLLGVNLPYLKLPVKPGRNMATLIEVAARNQILKNRGVYTARELDKRLRKRLAG